MDQRSFYIGCSGYYYPYWKGRFYPNGVQPKNWLAHYGTVFNSVDLNGSFYRTPRLVDLQKYAEVTPRDFLFSIKISRYITHIRRLDNCRSGIEDLVGIYHEGLGKKLGKVLFQMPPSFHYSEEHLRRITEQIPHSKENVIEFRHISWWSEGVQNALRDCGLTFCNVNFPGLSSFMINTSADFYFRFHGSPELFKSAYSDEALTSFVDMIPEQDGNYHIYFNNTYYEAGYTNALQLMNLLKLKGNMR